MSQTKCVCCFDGNFFFCFVMLSGTLVSMDGAYTLLGPSSNKSSQKPFSNSIEVKVSQGSENADEDNKQTDDNTTNALSPASLSIINASSTDDTRVNAQSPTSNDPFYDKAIPISNILREDNTNTSSI